MTLKLHRALLGLALVCLHGLSSAEVPAATAEALMHKSGVWAQLGDVATQVKAGMAQSMQGASMADEDIERLNALADSAFGAERLRAAFLQVVSQRATPADSASALKWYDSPTGKAMTALEEASSASFDDMNRVMADGNRALAKASAKRQTLLNQTVKASRAVEGMVTMQINTTVAVLQGVAKVVPNQPKLPAAEMRKAFEAQRPQMVASSMGVMLSMFALTYQGASDKALEQYIKFLSSKAGVALTLTMEEALDASMSHAAEALGIGIPKTPGTLSL